MELFLPSAVSTLSEGRAQLFSSPQDKYNSSGLFRFLCDTASLQVGAGHLSYEGDQERIREGSESKLPKKPWPCQGATFVINMLEALVRLRDRFLDMTFLPVSFLGTT